jgi:hypothetical protein
MKKYIPKVAVLIISIFTCTACFDIRETIFLKKDGSGKFTFVIDMSELKVMFGSSDDSTSATSGLEVKKPTDKIDSKFEDIKKELRTIDGISNIIQNVDTSNIIVTIGFDFKNVTALNGALNVLFKDEENLKPVTYYEYKNKQFTRLESASKGFLKAGFEDKNAPKGKSDAGKAPFNLDGLFQTISYTTTYEFENEIQKSANKEALLTADQKKIILKCYPFVEDSTKKCSLTNTITLK